MVFGASNSTGCSGMHGASRRYDQHQFAAATPLPVRWTSEWPRNGRCRATRMKVSVAGLGRSATVAGPPVPDSRPPWTYDRLHGKRTSLARARLAIAKRRLQSGQPL